MLKAAHAEKQRVHTLQHTLQPQLLSSLVPGIFNWEISSAVLPRFFQIPCWDPTVFSRPLINSHDLTGRTMKPGKDRGQRKLPQSSCGLPYPRPNPSTAEKSKRSLCFNWSSSSGWQATSLGDQRLFSRVQDATHITLSSVIHQLRLLYASIYLIIAYSSHHPWTVQNQINTETLRVNKTDSLADSPALSKTNACSCSCFHKVNNKHSLSPIPHA